MGSNHETESETKMKGKKNKARVPKMVFIRFVQKWTSQEAVHAKGHAGEGKRYTRYAKEEKQEL
jgi:hypothetical protein